VSRRATTAQRREAAEARRAHRASITEPDLVMEAAAGFLAVRPRSVEETRRRLAYLGFPAALCDQVIERLLEMGYLDDTAFARAWVDSRDRARPRGSSALRSELQRKGVPDATIREILDERAATGAAPMVRVTATMSPADGGADREAARRLLERRASALSREADLRRRRQKAYALLARSGFSPDICQDLASSVADDLPGDDIKGV
jgi:regulatory protein